MRKLIVLMLLMLVVPTMAIAACEDGETTYIVWSGHIHRENESGHDRGREIVVIAPDYESALERVGEIMGKEMEPERMRYTSPEQYMKPRVHLRDVEERLCPGK